MVSFTGAWFPNELQLLRLKTGHEDGSPQNDHQDYMPYYVLNNVSWEK